MDSKIKTIINGRHRGCHLAVAGVRCPGLVARRTRSVARARTGSEPPSVSRRTDKGLYVGYPPKPGPRSLFANGVHGFSVLEADAKELKVRLFDRNLSLLYEYVLRKSISRTDYELGL